MAAKPEFLVQHLQPGGPALLGPATRLRMAPANAAGRPAGAPASETVRYEDLGGLAHVVENVREVVELPLKHPAAFTRLGITPAPRRAAQRAAGHRQNHDRPRRGL